jgi:hypothetical protein
VRELRDHLSLLLARESVEEQAQLLRNTGYGRQLLLDGGRL